MVDLIQPTKFSIQFVLDKIGTDENGQQKVQANKLPISQLEGFETKNISEGNAFLSKILRLTLHWKMPNEGNLPSSVIMKVPSPQHKKLLGERGEVDWTNDPEIKWLCEYLIGAHKREISFYTNFPRLNPALRFPKFFFGSEYHPSHQEGLILMEDLTTRATTIPVLPGFNDAQVRELVSEVARLHSTSWQFPEWERMVCPEKVTFAPADLIQGMMEGAKKLKEFDPLFGPLVERILPLFTQDNCDFASYSGRKFGFPASIIHGDLYSPNILWEKDAQGRPTDRLCAIIDWQSVHSGNPCQDLCRMLALNTPGEYRRKETQKLLDFYGQKVAEFMGGKAPFTMDQLRDAYNHAMPFAMMFLCYGIPFYHDMDSIVGIEPAERKQNQRELLERSRMFLEDSAAAKGF